MPRGDVVSGALALMDGKRAGTAYQQDAGKGHRACGGLGLVLFAGEVKAVGRQSHHESAEDRPDHLYILPCEHNRGQKTANPPPQAHLIILEEAYGEAGHSEFFPEYR